MIIYSFENKKAYILAIIYINIIHTFYLKITIYFFNVKKVYVLSCPILFETTVIFQF